MMESRGSDRSIAEAARGENRVHADYMVHEREVRTIIGNVGRRSQQPKDADVGDEQALSEADGRYHCGGWECLRWISEVQKDVTLAARIGEVLGGRVLKRRIAAFCAAIM